jgi:hypothetical protein
MMSVPDSLTNYDVNMVRSVNMLLNEIIDSGSDPVIIETGTYRGKGTTRMLAEATAMIDADIRIYTIESHWDNYLIAKKNLEEYNWITPIYGLSVHEASAIKFIDNNDVLVDQEKYGVQIDTNIPVAFYKSEIKGNVSAWGESVPKMDREQQVLERLVAENYGNNYFLFVLDSCGGIGWLEFEAVGNLMCGSPFSVWLHDINHVKHFRSYKEIVENPDWMIVAEETNEWVLATYSRKI